MSDTIANMGHATVLICSSDGDTIRDVSDLVGAALSAGAHWIALPAQRLDGDFFQLRSGIAGEFVQKLVNYRIGLAVIGDISAHTAASSALRDFVGESNRGTQAWFLPDLDAFRLRLAGGP